jgi:hypothetical protein
VSVRAHLAWRSGRTAEALRLIESMHGDRWYQLTLTSPFFGQAHDRYLRAELLRTLGRDEEAAGWYAALGESSPFEIIYLAPAARALGLMAERAGDRALAATHFARALEVWGEGGEPGHLSVEIRQKLEAWRRRGVGAPGAGV